MTQKTTRRKRTTKPVEQNAPVTEQTVLVTNAPEISVLIPTRGNAAVIWLALESLARQVDAPAFEVIISECKSSSAASEVIAKYTGRLNITHIQNDKQLPVSLKWRQMAHVASAPLCAMMGADDYAPSNWLRECVGKLSGGHDWVYAKQGVFYNFHNARLAEWRMPFDRSGLWQATTTEAMQALPEENIGRGVDGWMFGAISPRSIAAVEYADGVLTDGYNTLSSHRAKFYTDSPARPFYATEKTLSDLVPTDVATKMKKMRVVVH
jgi:glycosyltransferase involved in cell wall biosynthesis